MYEAFEIPLARSTLSNKNLFEWLKLFFLAPCGQSKVAMKRVSSNIEKGKLILFTTQKYAMEDSQVT